LRTALVASETIGLGVITHPLDDGVRGLYARWGFQDLPFDPRRAMFVRMVVLRASFAETDGIMELGIEGRMCQHSDLTCSTAAWRRRFSGSAFLRPTWRVSAARQGQE